MPVRLREVAGDRQALRAKRVEDMLHDVRLRVLRERAARHRHLEVGILRVEQAEAVVMFRREDKVLEAVAAGGLGPDVRLEADRVERLGHRPVLALERLAVRLPVNETPGPSGLLIDERPRLVDAELGIWGSR